MLNTSRDVVRACISLRGRQIEIVGPGRRVISKVRVHVCHLTSVCAHASSRLTRFDVAPDHRSHVALVVHEAGIEVWRLIGIGGLDVSGAAREWVFLVNGTFSKGLSRVIG